MAAMRTNLYKKILIVYLSFLCLGFFSFLFLFRPMIFRVCEENNLSHAIYSRLFRDGMLFLLCIDLISLLIPLGFYYLCQRPLHDTVALSDFFLGRSEQFQPRKVRTLEFVKLQANLNFMADEATHQLEMQQEALGNISHDFRSPLTSIKGYTEAMLDGTIPPDKQKHYLEVILEMSNQMHRLADDILSVSKLTSGHSPALYITTFDLNELIFSLVFTVELECQKKQIHLVLDLEENLPEVYADREKMKHVILNLFDNAVKFSDCNEDLFIHTWSQKDQVYMSVKDYGVCISREDLSKIWTRYYKVDSSRGPSSGSGVGLTIVRQILALHNQPIHVTSSEENGTEFTFSLPADKKTK